MKLMNVHEGYPGCETFICKSTCFFFLPDVEDVYRGCNWAPRCSVSVCIRYLLVPPSGTYCVRLLIHKFPACLAMKERRFGTGKALSHTQNWCGVVRVANVSLCAWSSKQLSKIQRASNSYLKTSKVEIFRWEMSPWHFMRTATRDCHCSRFPLEARFLCRVHLPQCRSRLCPC